jgi:hypothetical protein
MRPLPIPGRVEHPPPGSGSNEQDGRIESAGFVRRITLLEMGKQKMKSLNRSNRQAGFVDLGMSLVVIMLAGGIAYGIESSPADQVAASRPGIAAEQSVQPATTEISANRTADAGQALQ